MVHEVTCKVFGEMGLSFFPLFFSCFFLSSQVYSQFIPIALDMCRISGIQKNLFRMLSLLVYVNPLVAVVVEWLTCLPDTQKIGVRFYMERESSATSG